MKTAISVSLLEFLLLAGTSLADVTVRYRANVVDIVDGNTIVVSNRISQGDVKLTGQARVKLDGMAAPETDQPGGQEAKSFLERLVKDKEVLVVELTDMGKSRGAWVFVGEDEKSVNALLIEEGQAWLTEPRAISFAKSRQAYDRMKETFQQAKDRKRGIWASENPIPPWEWAKQHGSQKE